jgi:tRNA(Glu) U13 pseudouridine synthase TruD
MARGGGVVILKAGGWQSTVGLWFWSLTKGWRGQNGTGLKKKKSAGDFKVTKQQQEEKKRDPDHSCCLLEKRLCR